MVSRSDFSCGRVLGFGFDFVVDSGHQGSDSPRRPDHGSHHVCVFGVRMTFHEMNGLYPHRSRRYPSLNSFGRQLVLVEDFAHDLCPTTNQHRLDRYYNDEIAPSCVPCGEEPRAGERELRRERS